MVPKTEHLRARWGGLPTGEYRPGRRVNPRRINLPGRFVNPAEPGEPRPQKIAAPQPLNEKGRLFLLISELQIHP
jgi:hypothetical protein